jgi:acetyl/propionyl-CoA carboxylase alpha subunit
MVTGIDLVEKQIRIAAGEPLGLTQEEVRLSGRALELRINAEDPDDDFRPDPGTVTVWEPPKGSGAAPLLRFAIQEVPGKSRASAGSPDGAPRSALGPSPVGFPGGERGVSSGGATRRPQGAHPGDAGGPSDEAEGADGVRLRLDSHVEAGYTVPPFYDSLLGKLILHAPDRPTLIDAAEHVVAVFRVEGIKTTLPILARVLAWPAFRSGDYGLDTLAEVLGEQG